MEFRPSSNNPVADSELVQACLAGNREAFGAIVVRYQSLICSLAYSATGNLSRSEDLAQETFISAWQQLSRLREPAKLKAWLCGIARRLISNAQRRINREPAHLGEPFTAAHESATPEVSPTTQAISHEEETILWRALEQIPETYRDPLVLYYREQQSVRKVAEALDLSEDAVKQRLVRGRTLLHEQVLAFVEGTLERSKPGQVFMLGVMTALPVLSPSLATVAGATATQGAMGTKPTTWLAALGALVSAQVLWFISSMAFVTGVGGFAGWQMGSPASSAIERRWALWFWRGLTGGLFIFVLPVLLLGNGTDTSPATLAMMKIWFALFYVVTGVPFIFWAIANHQRIRTGGPQMTAAGPGVNRAFRRWVLAGTLALAVLFCLGQRGSHWYDRIPSDRIWEVVTTHPGAKLRIYELESGGRWIDLDATGSNSAGRYAGPINDETYQRIQQAGIPYQTRVQGRDYDVLGWPARRLPLVMLLGLSAGCLALFRICRRKP